MTSDTEHGRSPDGSGHSAEPEPSSTVSAVPVSVPNAEIPHPRLIKRYCGGWLAVSPTGCSLKIGATGPTSEAAEANYRESYAACTHNLVMGGYNPPTMQSERTRA